MEEYLYKKLEGYSKENIYPFHMPGHKRKRLWSINPYELDITEINGFDNLHHPEDIIKKAQERAANLYGAEQCYFLVNGSTCGILASVCAAANKKNEILAARNCHKSVYHGILINELKAVYINPYKTKQGLQGSVSPENVKKGLDENKNIRAVVITSPTYDGIVSNIEEIARLCHSKNVPLIVDQAHGAHFGFGSGFPENAIKSGADAVIVSTHKTVPALTQTALLFINGSRLDRRKIEKYLDIFETSSPSYLLMSSIDFCIKWMRENGKEALSKLREYLDHFYQDMKKLRYLHVVDKSEWSPSEVYDFDNSKIIIVTEKSGMTGIELSEILRKEYGIEVEMSCSTYVMALATLMDEREGIERLSDALLKIDAAFDSTEKNAQKRKENGIDRIQSVNEKKMEIYEASESETEEIDYRKSSGRISACFLVPYPPGIPEIVPGEIISEEIVMDLEEKMRRGIEIEGISRNNGIEVVK